MMARSPEQSSEPDSEKGSFARSLSNAGWLTGGRFFGDLAGLVLFVVFARHFGPSGIGVYAFALAIGQFVFSVTNMSLEDYAIRECMRLSVSERRGLIGQLLGTQVVVSGIVLLLFLVSIALVQESSELFIAAGILSAYQVFLAFSKTLFVPAFAEQKMAFPSLLEFVTKLLAVAISLILIVVFETGISATLLPFPLAGLVLLVASAGSCVRHINKISVRINAHDLTQVLRKLWPFALSIIVFQIYARADVVMLTLMLDEAQAGLYASALKCLEVGGMPLFYMGVATYPALSAFFAENNIGKFSVSADMLLRVTLTLGGLLAWGLFCIVPELAVPVFGEDFAATADIAKMLIGLAILMAIASTMVRTLMAAHLQIQRVKLQSYAVVVNISLNLVLIPIMGIVGAIVASVIAETLANVWYFLEIRKVDRGIASKLATTIRQFIVSVAACAAVISALSILGQSGIVIAAVSLLVYLLALKWTDFIGLKDLMPGQIRVT